MLLVVRCQFVFIRRIRLIMAQKRMFQEFKVRKKSYWALWPVVASIIIWLYLFLSSCSGSRHMVKSESKIDSSSVVKTEVHKYSIVNSSTTKVVTENTDNDVTTKDDYTEETTYYYGKDSGNIPTVTHKVTKRTGSTTTIDKSKKKTEVNAKDTTAINVQSDKKEELKKEVSQSQENKNAKSNFNVSAGKFFVIVGLVILILSIGYWAYKRYMK